MHDLIDKLTKYLNLTPEQQFRVSAMIKREIHEEKSDLFRRYSYYSEGASSKWIHDILVEKAESHEEWAKKSDEEIITWSVGTHKYVQKIEPCSVCGEELTGKPYSRVIENGKNNTFCQTHSVKE